MMLGGSVRGKCKREKFSGGREEIFEFVPNLSDIGKRK